ncbi:hypothetical protein ACLK1X_02080 [Escherichia coli]
MHGRYTCRRGADYDRSRVAASGKNLIYQPENLPDDGSGQMAITVDVEVASDTPHPAGLA